MVPRVRVPVKAILFIILLKLLVLTCGNPDLHSTPNSIPGTTTVVCSSNSSLVIVTFHGVDLTKTSSSGQEYQRTLIKEGILVGKCVESKGEITCVFNTSIANGIFECCAGLCANITLSPHSQTTITTTLEPENSSLRPGGPGLSHWIVVDIASVGSALLFVVFGFIFIIGIIIYIITGICKKKPVNPDNNDPDNNTALQTEEIPSTNQALSITSPILPTSTEEKSDSSCRTEMAGTRMRTFSAGYDVSRSESDTFEHDQDGSHQPTTVTAFSNELGPSSATIQDAHFNGVSEVNTPAKTVVIMESDIAGKSGPSSATISQQESMGSHSCSTPNAGTRVPLSNGRGKSTSFVLLENPASINDNGDVSLNMDVVARHSQDLYPLAFSKDSEAQPESHDSRMEEYVVSELVNSGPLLDSTTERQYSEIGGFINKEGIHYAHVNPKPKPEGLPDQPVDPTAVVYSEVKKDKLAPKSEESEQPPQTKRAPPTPPPPPTAESLLSIIHPIACKWEEFGKALGIDEDRLDDFSNEAHDQVRLHDMVHYYFNNVHVKHTWEEFVQALRKIEEYECADKIVREKRLEAHPVTVHPPSANGDPPTGVPTEPIHVHVEDLGSGYPVKKLNDEAVQMPVHIGMCTTNLKMTSADDLECAEVTVHPPNANGEPPTTVVPTEPMHVGSGYPAKRKPNDEAVQMPVYMCTPNLKMTSVDKPDVEEQRYPIEPGGVIPASLSPLLPTPDNHM